MSLKVKRLQIAVGMVLFLVGINSVQAGKNRAVKSSFCIVFTSNDAFYRYLIDYFWKIDVVPARYQTEPEFRHLFVEKLLRDFPSFAFIKKGSTGVFIKKQFSGLKQLFSAECGASYDQKFMNCLYAEERVMVRAVAVMIHNQCVRRWHLANLQDL